MDAEDNLHPLRLEKQIGFLSQHAEVCVLSSKTSFHSNLGMSEECKLFTQWQNNLIIREEHYLSRFVESPLAHPTAISGKKLIEKFALYDTGNDPEDYELWLRRFGSGVNIYKNPETLLQWNDHAAWLSRTHNNCSKTTFYTIKWVYLAAWMKRSLAENKKIVVCGSLKISRKLAELLHELSIEMCGYTDVKYLRNRSINFISLHLLNEPENWFIVNFISKRDLSDSVRTYYMNHGFVKGQDFILAA